MTGDAVKSGINVLSAGVKILKEGYDVAAPVLKQGYDAVSPVVESAVKVTTQAAAPVLKSATPVLEVRGGGGRSGSGCSCGTCLAQHCGSEQMQQAWLDGAARLLAWSDVLLALHEWTSACSTGPDCSGSAWYLAHTLQHPHSSSHGL